MIQNFSEYRDAHSLAIRQDKAVGYSVERGFHVADKPCTFEVCPGTAGNTFDAYRLVAALCAARVAREMYDTAGLVNEAVPYESVHLLANQLFPDTKG